MCEARAYKGSPGIDHKDECFLSGINQVVLNQATINRMIGFVLKRFGHVPTDAVVTFRRFDDNTFTFTITNRDYNGNEDQRNPRTYSVDGV